MTYSFLMWQTADVTNIAKTLSMLEQTWPTVAYSITNIPQEVLGRSRSLMPSALLD